MSEKSDNETFYNNNLQLQFQIPTRKTKPLPPTFHLSKIEAIFIDNLF